MYPLSGALKNSTMERKTSVHDDNNYISVLNLNLLLTIE